MNAPALQHGLVGAAARIGNDRLVLASNNAGKLAEFDGLLAPLGLQILPQGALGVSELLDRLTASVLESTQDDLGRRIAYRTLATMAQVARRPDASPEVAAG